MTTYQWLCILGVPTIVLGLLGVIWKQLLAIRALRKGVQALLRKGLIDDYNKWDERGYAPIYARQNFENMWEQYHALYKNGVMDDLHDKFLQLPTEPKTKEE